jgi:hypothetical protein
MRRWSWPVLSTLAALLLFALVVRAAEAPGDRLLTVNKQAGGRPYRIAVTGTVAYVAQDRFIRPLDVRMPTRRLRSAARTTCPRRRNLAVTARGCASTYNAVYVSTRANRVT